jgi:hypothetical protein
MGEGNSRGKEKYEGSWVGGGGRGHKKKRDIGQIRDHREGELVERNS